MSLGIDEQAFNEAPKPTSSNFGEVPNGNYLAQIEESQIRQNRSGNGQHWKLNLRIRGGEFRKRMLFLNQTITNNPTSLMYLKNAAEAVGFRGNINDLDQHVNEFVGVFALANVRNYKDKNGTDQQNITLFQIDGVKINQIKQSIINLAQQKDINFSAGLQQEFPGKTVDTLTIAELADVKEKLDDGTFGVMNVPQQQTSAPVQKEERFYF